MKFILTSIAMLGTFSVSQCAFSNLFEKTHTVPATENSSKYECPTPGTVIDCMPKINQELSPYCRPELRSWVDKNCEDVSFVD